MKLEEYKKAIEESRRELEHLREELDGLNHADYPREAYQREYESINRHMKAEQEKIDNNAKIVDAYGKAFNTLINLRKLYEVEVNDDYETAQLSEEIDAKTSELKDALSILPDELQEELRKSILELDEKEQEEKQNDEKLDERNESKEPSEDLDEPRSIELHSDLKLNVGELEKCSDSLAGVALLYNNQIDKLKQINSEISRIKLAQEKHAQITEEQIEEWYVEDNIHMSLPEYKKQMKEEFEKKNSQYLHDIERLSDEYEANLYYLIDIKQELIIQLNATKRALEEKYDDLNDRYKELGKKLEKLNPSDPNYEESRLKILSERFSLDNAMLDLRRYSMQLIDSYLSSIKFSEEENRLMLRGLSPSQRKIYDEIDKTPLQKVKIKSEPQPIPVPPVQPVPVPPVQPVPVPPVQPVPVPPVPEDDEPVKVEKKSVWKWIKDHKKQILIAIGIAVVAAALIVLVTQLLPAMLAAQQAATTAGTFGQMVSNGGMWHAASAAEKVALHGANTALASNITAATGVPGIFNTTTGIWTFAGKALPVAAKAAASTAAQSAAGATLLSNLTMGLGIGGLGVLGTGLLLPKQRSDKYKEINKVINKLKSAYSTLSEEEFSTLTATLDKNINSSKELSTLEREVLSRKLAAIKEKAAKKASKKEKKREL